MRIVQVIIRKYFLVKIKILDSYVSRYFPAKVEPIDPLELDSEVSYKYVRKGESNQNFKDI